MIKTSIAKASDESREQYHFRLYEDREELGLSNQQVADLLNAIDGTDYDESKFRKEYQAYKNVWEKLVEEKQNSYLPDDYLKEIDEKLLNFEKEKIKFLDQKRMMRTELRKLARLESLKEHAKSCIEAIEPITPPLVNVDTKIKEAVVAISDIHLGMEINNEFNVYNKDIALERLTTLKEKTLRKVRREGINTLHIASLGDHIHGHIHTTARIDSEMNVIEQITLVSQYLTDFVETFLQEGINVNFYSVSGNHSRSTPNKNDSLGTSESFERLITTILDTAFSKFENYNSVDDKDGMILLNISGKNILLVHGDMDYGANMVTKLTQLLGVQIDYILSGHVHHFFMKEHGLTTQYGVGSMCGTDQYAIKGRFSGRPSQLILTFNENDIEELTPVYFK